jgi:hypothetical protein
MAAGGDREALSRSPGEGRRPPDQVAAPNYTNYRLAGRPLPERTRTTLTGPRQLPSLLAAGIGYHLGGMIVIDPARQFCDALMAESTGAPVPWYVSIDKVAARLGLSVEECVAIAEACEEAGLVRPEAPGARGTTEHRVALAAGGWRLLRKPLAR